MTRQAPSGRHCLAESEGRNRARFEERTRHVARHRRHAVRRDDPRRAPRGPRRRRTTRAGPIGGTHACVGSAALHQRQAGRRGVVPDRSERVRLSVTRWDGRVPQVSDWTQAGSAAAPTAIGPSALVPLLRRRPVQRIQPVRLPLRHGAPRLLTGVEGQPRKPSPVTGRPGSASRTSRVSASAVRRSAHSAGSTRRGATPTSTATRNATPASASPDSSR